MAIFEIEADITYVLPDAWLEYAESKEDAIDQFIHAAINSRGDAIDAQVDRAWVDDPDQGSWWGRIYLHTAQVLGVECEYETTIQDMLTAIRRYAEPDDGQIVKFQVTALKMTAA